MKIIKPSFEILTKINSKTILKEIEKVARTCYKSEDKIKKGSTEEHITIIKQS
jgi:thymidylate synthase (FAD)